MDEDLLFDLDLNLKAKKAGIPATKTIVKVQEEADRDLSSYLPEQLSRLRNQRKKAMKQALVYHSLLARLLSAKSNPDRFAHLLTEAQTVMKKPSEFY